MTTSIVGYRPEYREAFARLNLEWLVGNGLFEDADRVYLEDPEGHILHGAGAIFFALDEGTVVGTCAAIPVSPAELELAKLAVAPAAQGRGIGRLLTEAVLAHARAHGVSRVVLTSNSVLVAAVHLYESLGFRHAALPADIRYETANVYMTLDL